MSDSEEGWPETHWSMIGRTRDGESRELGERAWTDLLESYRVPIEIVLRRYLAGVSDADEAVASFFGYLFEGRVLDKPSSGGGRFRAYIQAIARNYALYWKSGKTRRPTSTLSLDEVEDTEPDGAAWLPTILDLGLERMRSKDAALLRGFYGLGGAAPRTAELLAEELRTSRAAIYKRLHGARLRLREEIQDLLRDLSADDAGWRLELDWLEEALDGRLVRPPLD